MKGLSKSDVELVNMLKEKPMTKKEIADKFGKKVNDALLIRLESNGVLIYEEVDGEKIIRYGVLRCVN